MLPERSRKSITVEFQKRKKQRIDTKNKAKKIKSKIGTKEQFDSSIIIIWHFGSNIIISPFVGTNNIMVDYSLGLDHLKVCAFWFFLKLIT